MPDKEFEKLPPQSIEAEQSVLGSLLLDKKAVIRIADILKTDDFYRDVHGIIYKTMLELFEKNEPIDLMAAIPVFLQIVVLVKDFPGYHSRSL